MPYFTIFTCIKLSSLWNNYYETYILLAYLHPVYIFIAGSTRNRQPFTNPFFQVHSSTGFLNTKPKRSVQADYKPRAFLGHGKNNRKEIVYSEQPQSRHFPSLHCKLGSKAQAFTSSISPPIFCRVNCIILNWAQWTMGNEDSHYNQNTDGIALNEKLFASKAVYWKSTIWTKQKKVVGRAYKDFVRGGTQPGCQEIKTAWLNGEISMLQLAFSQNIPAESNAFNWSWTKRGA